MLMGYLVFEVKPPCSGAALL